MHRPYFRRKGECDDPVATHGQMLLASAEPSLGEHQNIDPDAQLMPTGLSLLKLGAKMATDDGFSDNV